MSATGDIVSAERPVAPAAALSLRDASFAYDDGPEVVSGVSISLEPGKLTTLIGPNAAGKSTLVRLMLGQLEPTSGSVALDGRGVSRWSPMARAAVMSYVPQRAGVTFAFTVEQVVEMGRHAVTPSRAAVDAALESCDLTDLRGRVFQRLSYGQQQRVLLARAVAQAAGGGRIMLLDEPGSAMDLWHLHRMMAGLADLARRGLAVLVVLHDLSLAAQYADLVWLMDRGRLAAAGPWAEVMRPELLEPVYRVGLRVLRDGHERPVFAASPR